MKCEITKDGFLEIAPESALEKFALSKWDKKRITILEKDWFVEMQKSSKELTAMIELRKEEFHEFLRQKELSDSAGEQL